MDQNDNSTRKIIKRTDQRKSKLESSIYDQEQSQLLLGQKLKLIQEREEWSNEFIELEKLIEKKLCISQVKIHDENKINLQMEIDEYQDPNHQMKCQDICNMNFTFNEELPLIQMIRDDDAAFSFGQAEVVDQPERFSYFSFAPNECPIISNMDDQDFNGPEITFSPQNHTQEQFSENQQNVKRRRRIYTRSFNTMKHTQNKKIRKNIRENNQSFKDTKLFLRQNNLKMPLKNEFKSEI